MQLRDPFAHGGVQIPSLPARWNEASSAHAGARRHLTIVNFSLCGIEGWAAALLAVMITV
jgi:hypothetical protein